MAKTKKEEREGIDFIENPDAAVSKAEEFLSDKKNQNLVSIIGGVIAIVVAGYLAFNYYMNNKNLEAQEEMFQAVYYFELDSLTKALNGDGNNYGFLDIVDQYSGTEAANLSKFYIGTIYINLGDYESASRYLEDFSSGDEFLQARAYALIGDCYVERDDLENAVKYFNMAVEHKPDPAFTPYYLMKLAIVLEEQGQLTQAISAYDQLIEEYVDASMIQDARRHKARVEGLLVE